MPNILTQEAVKRIRDQFSKKPRHLRPRLYAVACNPRGASIRKKLERWAASLPRDILGSLIPRLLNPRNHKAACGELLLAHILIEGGFDVEFEPVMSGLTPDFLVAPKGSCADFILEVFTEHMSDEDQKAEQQQNGLIDKINSLPGCYSLAVQFMQAKFPMPKARLDRVAADLRAWVRTAPDSGDRIQIERIGFQVIKKDRRFKRVRADGISYGAWFVGTQRPRRKILDKLRRYKRVAATSNKPLAIAYVIDFKRGTSPRTIANALFGQEVTRVLVDLASNQPIGSYPDRKRNGIFGGRGQALSAVVVVEEIDGDHSVTTFHNPRATCPLPPLPFGSNFGFPQASRAD